MSDPLEAIRASLPPAADSLTWLTILEYNLTPDLLPELEKILQDKELTADVGWNIVEICTPLLPESKSCLLEVARLGNPRECVLKVTEMLRQIQIAPEDPDQILGEERIQDEGSPEEVQLGKLKLEDASYARDFSHPDQPPSKPALTFMTLVSLLTILHPRIHTAYPSRFIASTLQAVLRTFNDASRALPATEMDQIVSEILRFVARISGKKRPLLPPRKSTQDVLPTLESAPDPEGNGSPSTEELKIQKRLFQAFITHMIEDVVLRFPLSWSARFQEKFHPDKVVRSRSEEFKSDPALQARESMIGQLAAAAQDLDLYAEEIFQTATAPEIEPSDAVDDDGPPSSPSAIPLSRAGALFLLASRTSSSFLFGSSTAPSTISIFPEHAILTEIFIGRDGVDAKSADGGPAIGTGSEAVSDAVIALGLYALNNERIGEFPDEDSFMHYLQTLSIVSANHCFSDIRYCTHTLCSAVLHSHPSSLVRLGIIRDVLEHCPFESLKGSAVGWLKDELLNARASSPDESIFATSSPVKDLWPYLLPDLGPLLQEPPLTEAWINLKINMTFFLATLNFLYIYSLGLRDDQTLKTDPKSTDPSGRKEDYLEMLAKKAAEIETELNGNNFGLPSDQSTRTDGLQLKILLGLIQQVRDAEKTPQRDSLV